MLIAYVSDERYVALPDVLLEFEGEAGSFEARRGRRDRCTSICPRDLTRSRFKSRGSAPRACNWRSTPSATSPISSGCLRTACSAMPGPSG